MKKTAPLQAKQALAIFRELRDAEGEALGLGVSGLRVCQGYVEFRVLGFRVSGLRVFRVLGF